MESYLAKKRNVAQTDTARAWMNLENVMLSERSQTQKATYGMTHFCDVSTIASPQSMQIGGFRSCSRDKWGLTAHRHRFLFGVMKVFWN